MCIFITANRWRLCVVVLVKRVIVSSPARLRLKKNNIIKVYLDVRFSYTHVERSDGKSSCDFLVANLNQARRALQFIDRGNIIN